MVRPSNEPGGHGHHVSEIEDGDWIAIDPVNLYQIDSVTYRVSALGLGGSIEVHVDAPDGPLISETDTFLPTLDDQVYQDVTAPITDPGGTHTLYFVFRGIPIVPRLFNVNWIDFNGAGVSAVDVDLDGVDNELDNCPLLANDQSRQRRYQQHHARRDRRRLPVRRRQRQRHRERPGRERDQAPRVAPAAQSDFRGAGQLRRHRQRQLQWPGCERREARGAGQTPNPKFGQDCHNATGTPVPPDL